MDRPGPPSSGQPDRGGSRATRRREHLALVFRQRQSLLEQRRGLRSHHHKIDRNAVAFPATAHSLSAAVLAMVRDEVDVRERAARTDNWRTVDRLVRELGPMASTGWRALGPRCRRGLPLRGMLSRALLIASGSPFAHRSRSATVGVVRTPGSRDEYAAVMDRITIDPKVMGGVPCLRGLRIPVATVVNMIAGGMSAQQVVDELPPLELADVSAALRYAADAVADREIPLQPAG